MPSLPVTRPPSTHLATAVAVRLEAARLVQGAEGARRRRRARRVGRLLQGGVRGCEGVYGGIRARCYHSAAAHEAGGVLVEEASEGELHLLRVDLDVLERALMRTRVGGGDGGEKGGKAPMGLASALHVSAPGTASRRRARCGWVARGIPGYNRSPHRHRCLGAWSPAW